MLDWSRIAQLREEIGAEDFEEVAALFLEEAAEAVDRLRSAQPPGDLSDNLHFLKGCALNFGFSSLAERCSEGERMVADGRADAVDVAAIIALFERSRAQFLAGLDRQPAA